MLEDVTKRLASFGYVVTDPDAWLLNFGAQKIENHIASQCNTVTVPPKLHESAVDMVVGEFLLAKKSIGQLTGIDAEAIKSIQEGDTTVIYAQSDEERLDVLINHLMQPVDLSSYRRIRW